MRSGRAGNAITAWPLVDSVVPAPAVNVSLSTDVAKPPEPTATDDASVYVPGRKSRAAPSSDHVIVLPSTLTAAAFKSSPAPGPFTGRGWPAFQLIWTRRPLLVAP